MNINEIKELKYSEFYNNTKGIAKCLNNFFNGREITLEGFYITLNCILYGADTRIENNRNELIRDEQYISSNYQHFQFIKDKPFFGIAIDMEIGVEEDRLEDENISESDVYVRNIKIIILKQ